ncbi:MAG: aminopeptidase N C-terminal domain-containing protein, partial [Geminicoccaceae bacterium]
YATGLMLALIGARAAGRPLRADPGLADAFAATLAAPALERAFVAQALVLPAESFVGEQMAVIDVDGIHTARETLRAALGGALGPAWRRAYEVHRDHGPYRFDQDSVGRRALKNTALAYLMAAGDAEGKMACIAQLEHAANMTDRLAALDLLVESELPAREAALKSFYARWQDDALVIDKWFSLQATAQRPDAVEVVRRLLGHEAFRLNNPNRARALIGGFAAGNPTGFHRADGAGYALVAEQILALDALNPQVAARLLGPLSRWRRYDAGRQALMQGVLERILASPRLSREVYEIAKKSLT